MAKFSEWDSFNRNVQSGLTEGQFLTAQNTLIAAGPPNLAFLAADQDQSEGENDPAIQQNQCLVFPMGITQQFGIAETRQHARLFEIGSERSYWVSGRTVGQISLGRMVYHGPNLLRILYAYYRSTKGRHQFPDLMGSSDVTTAANENRNPHEIRISPGHKNIFMNLASDLFSQTMGLMVYFRDSNDESVYATYAENCVIPTYSLGLDAGGTVLQESVQLQFERLIPIHLNSAVALIDIDSSHKVTTGAGQVTARTGRNY